MGIYDRDYIHDRRPEGLGMAAHSPVVTIIIINVAVWVLQLVFGGDGLVTRLLASIPEKLFSGIPEIWRPLTANFVHDWRSPWHLFMNMLFLYFFGRELERIYRGRDFWALYLAAGTLGIFAETLSLYVASAQDPRLLRAPVLGASAAVAAVVVVFTLYYPTRQILFFFFIPMPVWVLCVLFILQDVLGVTSPQRDNVAHLAHLTGAGFGFLYKYFDLRWSRFFAPRRRRGRGLAGGLARVFSERSRRAAQAAQERKRAREEEISKRIDQLLEKISRHGMGSLSEEEREFLIENSRRYKSS